MKLLLNRKQYGLRLDCMVLVDTERSASAFEETFGSLRCLELRPTGFSESAPPHLCENLTCNGIEFAYQYILEITGQ